jgi:hypothetical protein
MTAVQEASGSNQVSGYFSWRPRWAAVAIGLFCVAAASSCSKVPVIKNKLPVFPVKGSVVMDGKPLAGAEVIYYPARAGFAKEAAQNQPQAHTDTDGNYVLSTYADHDGAPAGDYRVTVRWRGEGMVRDDDRNLLPKVYSDKKITKLRAKVEEGENTIPPFELKAPKEDEQQEASN